jgi:hypothetical protein
MDSDFSPVSIRKCSQYVVLQQQQKLAKDFFTRLYLEMPGNRLVLSLKMSF